MKISKIQKEKINWYEVKDSGSGYDPVLSFLSLFLLSQQPSVVQGLLIHEFSRSHTTTHHNQWDSSGQEISSSQRPLPDNTQVTAHRSPCPRWDSNPRSQQASGRRPLACWDSGFDSHLGHGYLSVVSVVCCQVEVSATSWSLVQRSPTDCAASLCVI